MQRIELDTAVAERRVFQQRALAGGLIFVLLLLALATRLAYLQVTRFEHFATRSDTNRLKILPTPPTRGLIYDRNGVLIAENRPTYRLELTPELIKDMDDTIERLKTLLDIEPHELKRFRKLLRRKPKFEGIPLLYRLNESELAQFAVNRHHFPGVDIAARLSRYYPKKGQLAHVVGYVSRITEKNLKNLTAPSEYAGTSHYGKIGVELAYEAALHGSVGFRKVEVNASGRVIETIEENRPIPGSDLYLTLDSELQAIATQALGESTGSIVVIDILNGDVLTMVSKPGYDANLFVNGISFKDYDALRDDKRQPLFNRSIKGQYPPGSTVKPFIALASLEAGINTAERRIFAGPFYQLPGDDHKYRDWKKTGHGWVNMDASIVQSCDVYFYDLAVRMGIDRMSEFMTQFGFGIRTNIDIGGESRGIFPSRQWKRKRYGLPWYPGETVITGIGQGYTQATPLQLASATATLANRGQGFQPRLIAAVRDPVTRQLMDLKPIALTQTKVVSKKNWDAVFKSMKNVIHSPRGTARRIAKNIEYTIAGKTGTAQVFTVAQDAEYEEGKLAKHLLDHALFIAFAPAEDPKIAIAVVVENGGHGGSVAAPIARKVLDGYFAKHRPKSNTETPHSTAPLSLQKEVL